MAIANVSNLRLRAAVTFQKIVAAVSLVTGSRGRFLTDLLGLHDAVTVIRTQSYFGSDYLVVDDDYAHTDTLIATA